MNHLFKKIRTVPDFPKPGILFYDITTLLLDPVGFSEIVEHMVEPFMKKKIEVVCGIESRGFIFGSAIANDLGAGFVPIRKPGKLPSKTIKQEYALEYGTDALEIHEDAIVKGQRVLVVDDLLATGGTCSAAVQLLNQMGAEVLGISFVIELLALQGRKKLENQNIHTIFEVS
ncbi:MAG: adenine phosphoribosyltransferase [Bdellovibrionales bacterium]|nr:adenine phosphoribosyltransferase [Bdellovibrionales bacterium]